MKTGMINFRKMTIIFVITFMLALTTASHAADTLGALGETPVLLKYIGSVNNQPVFQLSLNNSESDEFYVTIKDGAGNLLYAETVKGKDVTRKYRLNTDEIEVTGLRFEIENKSKADKFQYTIQKNSYYVEDMIVSKL